MFCANLGAVVGAPISYWASTLVGAGAELTRSVALGPSGGLYVVGDTTSSGAGGADAYIAKYAAAGSLSWQRTLGGAAADSFSQVSVAASGSIYACGSTASQGAGGTDGLIVKYDDTGAVVWQRSLGSATNQAFSGIGLDNSENVYVVGTSNTNVGFLAKYNSSGVIQWQRTLTDGTFAIGFNSVAVIASTGYSYICGSFGNDYFVAQYDTSGTIQSQVRYLEATGGGGNTNGISLDSSGNVYLTGLATKNTPTDYRMTLFKLNSAGNFVWQRSLDTGAASTEQGVSTFAAPSGDVYVVGYTSTGGTGSDSWLMAKYNTAGVIQWQRRLGTTASDVAWDVVVDTSATMWVTGSAGTDALTVKLPGDGSLTGTYGSITYAVSTVPEAADNFTLTTSAATSAASAFTDAARTLTAGTPTLTNTLTPIP